MKTSTNIFFLIFLMAGMVMVTSPNAQEQTCEGNGLKFIDLNGDGFNDNAPDHDGDGIPNGLDPDYIKRAQDGNGYKYGPLKKGSESGLTKTMTKAMNQDQKQIKAQIKAKTETQNMTQTQAINHVQAKTETQNMTETQAINQTQAKTETQNMPQTQVKNQLQAKTETQNMSETQAKIQAKAKTETQTMAKTQFMTKAQKFNRLQNFFGPMYQKQIGISAGSNESGTGICDGSGPNGKQNRIDQ